MPIALSRGLAALALATAALGALAAPPADGRQHVVIQVSDNDPGKWNLALNTARNVQADLGMDNVDVEVVVIGAAVEGVITQADAIGSEVGINEAKVVAGLVLRTGQTDGSRCYRCRGSCSG